MEPIGSQIGLLALNSSIIVVMPLILVIELLRQLSILKRRVYSTTKGFVVIFAVTSIVYSSFDNAILTMSLIATRRKYTLDSHRVFFGFQKLLEAWCEVGLIVFTALLFYSSVWKGLHYNVNLLSDSWSTSQRVTNFVGLKGVTILLCIVIAPIVVSTTVAESFVIMFLKTKALPDVVMGLRIASDVILYVPILFILPVVCVLSYNVLKTAERTTEDTVNTTGNDETSVEFDQVKARAKHASFIYFVLSGIFLFRLVLSMLHEMMFLLNYGGTLKKKNGVIVTDWLNTFLHWVFAAFFVIFYFLRFTEIEQQQQEPQANESQSLLNPSTT